jgi:hypothetical protein
MPCVLSDECGRRSPSGDGRRFYEYIVQAGRRPEDASHTASGLFRADRKDPPGIEKRIRHGTGAISQDSEANARPFLWEID